MDAMAVMKQPLKPLGLSIASLSLSVIEALSSHTEGWTPLAIATTAVAHPSLSVYM
ncbi:hypothetical protein AMTRI_Chr02g258260 [Amborella trichopoda]